MNEAGIAKRLLNVADLITGRMRGGLAQTNVVLSALNGGISGSTNADCAMDCKILVPEMVKRGMSPVFSALVTAASATITSTIPPGIGLILYSVMTDQSTAKMFFGGYIPGILMCATLMILVHIISCKRNYEPTRTYTLDRKTVLNVLRDSSWALVMPLGIILGLRFGVFTATEAGAVCVFYSLFVGFFVYKELELKKLPAILLESALNTTIVMFIILASASFGYYLTFERIPHQITELMVNLTESRHIFMLLTIILLLILGMFIDGTATLIILTPILAPIATYFGIDLIHFGLVICITITLGGLTPPFGTLIFITTALIPGVEYKNFCKECWPFVVALITVILLIAYVPALVMFLPNLFF
jgi:tripartite ATP-independent transporter DctM subunit